MRVTQTRPGTSALGRTLGLVAPVAAEYRLLGVNGPVEVHDLRRRPEVEDLRVDQVLLGLPAQLSVKHVLGPAMYAALACELAAGNDPNAAAAEIAPS